MANDLFSNLKAYFTKVTEGEHTPAEMASALNTWLRESGESVKTKVEEEVHHAVAKMGFIKREEFDALKRQVEFMGGVPISAKVATKTSTKKSTSPKKTAKKVSRKPTENKGPVKKATVKKAPPKKAAVKKVSPSVSQKP